MYRSHTCGALRLSDIGNEVTLAGWVQTIRKFGSITFVDLRDRYGITQLLFNESLNEQLQQTPLGREYVIQVLGKVIERSSKNPKIPTGDIEIEVSEFAIMNTALTPPFTIEEDTDGGDELRMKYRYLDLRRPVLKRNLELRYKVSRSARNYLDSQDFLEIETPFLIRSTPEGARDFIVPSRMNEGEFYALPQSPQTFKQLLMVSGYDRYYQIVKCFRDEDLRADRQPEFTQIDCEMSFVEQEDILQTFEGLFKHIFKDIKGIEMQEAFPRMTWDDAMWNYGNDKPDIRFDMKIRNLKAGHKVYCTALNDVDFKVTNEAETITAICVPGANEYTRKQTDELTEWVKRPQIGMTGLLFIKCNGDGSYKSSVDKFFSPEKLQEIAGFCGAQKGDLILILAGAETRTRKAMSELRLEMGNRLGERDKFGLKIVNRTTEFKSSKNIYSMRFSQNRPDKRYNRIDELGMINILKAQIANYSGVNLELIKLENGEIKTIYGNEIQSKNRATLQNIVLYKENGQIRDFNKIQFFLFAEGDNYTLSIVEKIREELSKQYNYKPLWVIDFPLFEYDEDAHRWVARHHPFTAPKPDHIHLMNDLSRYGEIKANAYDIVLNGTEIGGGSIRIFQRDLQEKMFAALGMSDEEAKEKFGFLMGAFEYGAPPHGGIAFGFDRLCALLGGQETIRDFIAFPKNNAGRDVMLNAPSGVDTAQLTELKLKTTL